LQAGERKLNATLRQDAAGGINPLHADTLRTQNMTLLQECEHSTA